jgi:limonene-1,2-epoxide hydrolase
VTVRLALLATAALLLPGCGSSPPSAESVVRAWSQALNTDDNERAADLFAPGAEVVQPGQVLRLRTHADAVAWNSALPCAGRIVSIKTAGQTATATFELGDRRKSRCDGPGQRATAIFRVVKGKIVLWHQTASPNSPPQPEV